MKTVMSTGAMNTFTEIPVFRKYPVSTFSITILLTVGARPSQAIRRRGGAPPKDRSLLVDPSRDDHVIDLEVVCFLRGDFFGGWVRPFVADPDILRRLQPIEHLLIEGLAFGIFQIDHRLSDQRLVGAMG